MKFFVKIRRVFGGSSGHDTLVGPYDDWVSAASHASDIVQGMDRRPLHGYRYEVSVWPPARIDAVPSQKFSLDRYLDTRNGPHETESNIFD